MSNNFVSRGSMFSDFHLVCKRVVTSTLLFFSVEKNIFNAVSHVATVPVLCSAKDQTRAS